MVEEQKGQSRAMTGLCAAEENGVRQVGSYYKVLRTDWRHLVFRFDLHVYSTI